MLETWEKAGKNVARFKMSNPETRAKRAVRLSALAPASFIPSGSLIQLALTDHDNEFLRCNLRR